MIIDEIGDGSDALLLLIVDLLLLIVDCDGDDGGVIVDVLPIIVIRMIVEWWRVKNLLLLTEKLPTIPVRTCCWPDGDVMTDIVEVLLLVLWKLVVIGVGVDGWRGDTLLIVAVVVVVIVGIVIVGRCGEATLFSWQIDAWWCDWKRER